MIFTSCCWDRHLCKKQRCQYIFSLVERSTAPACVAVTLVTRTPVVTCISVKSVIRIPIPTTITVIATLVVSASQFQFALPLQGYSTFFLTWLFIVTSFLDFFDNSSLSTILLEATESLFNRFIRVNINLYLNHDLFTPPQTAILDTRLIWDLNIN